MSEGREKKTIQKAAETASAAWAARSADRTKVRLLEAARELFSQRPYKSVTIRHIAGAAGVNVALINRYYGSKKNLFRCVVNCLIEEARAERTAQNTADPGQASVDGILALMGPENNAAKKRARFILSMILDPEVSDLVIEVVTQQIQSNRAFVHLNSDRETRAVLYGATLNGLSLYLLALSEKERARINKDLLAEFVKACFAWLCLPKDGDNKKQSQPAFSST